jgi:ferritin-like metal-binding protein YciE
MGLFSKDIKSMDELLIHGLQDIYYAENQIVKSLPTVDLVLCFFQMVL